MKIELVYIYPRVNHVLYFKMAKRFIASYQEHPPGETPHTITVVVNGGVVERGDRKLFDPLPVEFATSNNVGKDIGAFQSHAYTSKSDLMLCVGSCVHFHQAGWMDVLARAVCRNGPGLYGAFGFHAPAPHIRTTIFALPPPLLNSYPFMVTNDQRYRFEHGRQDSIMQHVKRMEFPALVVTNREILPQSKWRHLTNSECLFLDQHTDSIGYK